MHFVSLPLALVITVVVPLVLSLTLTSTLLKMTWFNWGCYLRTRLCWQRDRCLCLPSCRASILHDTHLQWTFIEFLRPAFYPHAICQCTCRRCNIDRFLSHLSSRYAIILDRRHHLKNSLCLTHFSNLATSCPCKSLLEMS